MLDKHVYPRSQSNDQSSITIQVYCLYNALHSSIGQNIKSLAWTVSGVRSPMSSLRRLSWA